MGAARRPSGGNKVVQGERRTRSALGGRRPPHPPGEFHDAPGRPNGHAARQLPGTPPTANQALQSRGPSPTAMLLGQGAGSGASAAIVAAAAAAASQGARALSPPPPEGSRHVKDLRGQAVASRVRSHRLAAMDAPPHASASPPAASSSPGRSAGITVPPRAGSRSSQHGSGSNNANMAVTGNTPASGAAASSGDSAGGLAGVAGLGIRGYDPRRLPRPEELLPRVAEPREQRVAASSASNNAASAASTALQVSGSAAAVVAAQLPVHDRPGADGGVSDLRVEDWTSDEEDAEEDRCRGILGLPLRAIAAQATTATSADEEDAAFDYREYRYNRSREARARAAPPEPHARRRAERARRAFAAQPRDESSDSGCSSPWGHRLDVSPRYSEAVSSTGGRGNTRSHPSTPCCYDEEPPEEDVSRIAQVLAKFYGLPGDWEQAVRLRYNAAVVTDHAWKARRRRDSQVQNPPMVWLRGGRVYDFKGDRGTLAEFEQDLLVRQVEDDAACRQRRKEQGLLPFPFVALPMRRGDEDDEADGVDAAPPSYASAAGARGGGLRVATERDSSCGPRGGVRRG